MSVFLPPRQYASYPLRAPPAKPYLRKMRQYFNDGLRMRKGGTARVQVRDAPAQMHWMVHQVDANTSNYGIAHPFQQYSRYFGAIRGQ
jgi:hypothetical protein